MIKLLHGDCLEILPSIPDGSIDLCLTDPPYGTTACKWDTVIPFEPMWEQLQRVVKLNGAICLFGSEPFSSRMRCSNLKQYKYDWIWDKVKPSGFQVAKYKPMQRHENISVFCCARLQYFPIMVKRDKVKIDRVRKNSSISFRGPVDGNNRVYTHKNPVSILVESNANQRGRLHPTQKPVPLLEYLIKTYTLEGETVLDFTMGSGSTGVAAVNLKRRFVGIEKEKEYCEIARARIEHASNEAEGQECFGFVD